MDFNIASLLFSSSTHLGMLFPDNLNLLLIKTACHLLAITTNERQGCPSAKSFNVLLTCQVLSESELAILLSKFPSML